MSTVWSIAGAIVALVIAWWLVSFLLSVVWFAVKLAIVAVVALVVFGLIKQLFRSRDG